MKDIYGNLLESGVKPGEPGQEASINIAYIGVWGMGSSSCALQVRRDLLDLEGVLQAEVSLEGRCAVAAFDARRLQADELLQAIEMPGGETSRRCWAELFLAVPLSEALERSVRPKASAGIISPN